MTPSSLRPGSTFRARAARRATATSAGSCFPRAMALPSFGCTSRACGHSIRATISRSPLLPLREVLELELADGLHARAARGDRERVVLRIELERRLIDRRDVISDRARRRFIEREREVLRGRGPAEAEACTPANAIVKWRSSVRVDVSRRSRCEAACRRASSSDRRRSGARCRARRPVRPRAATADRASR